MVPLRSLNTMSARSPGAAAAEGFVAGGQPDPAECQYFNAEGSTRILPLRVLPTELADLVLREGLAPHGEEIESLRLGYWTLSTVAQSRGWTTLVAA